MPGAPWVVALDEFQNASDFDETTVEDSLRTAVQAQRRVGYVFSGSEPSLIARLLRPRRPFYKAGPPPDPREDSGTGFRPGHRGAVRPVLSAVAREGGRGLLAVPVRARYGLGPKSSVQRALAGLAADDWLTREGDRYVFVDSLQREYVLRETW